MTASIPQRFVDPVRAPRAFEVAVENTIDGIERRRLNVGDALPTENQLARELAVSRPTTRQALHLLRDHGLLALRRGGGGGVFMASALIPMVAISTDILDPADIAEALTARRVMETAVTLYATRVANEDDLAEIDRTVTLLREHLGDTNAVAALNGMFHRAVGRATHSKYMVRTVHEINRRLAPVRRVYPPGPAEDVRTLEVHERQASAMRSRDLAAVEVAVDAHFRVLEEDVAQRRGIRREELLNPDESCFVRAAAAAIQGPSGRAAA